MKTIRLNFNDDMARAIVQGRKTVTRRPVVPHDIFDDFKIPPLGLTAPCSPGDLLIGRECWAANVPGCEFQSGVSYRADHNDKRGDGPAHPMKWRPSIHMPDWAARIRRRIVAVTVERLRDITEDDARREGSQDGGCETCGESSFPRPCGCHNPRPVFTEAFANAWDAIYATKGLGWDINPWVWRIEFSAENEP